MHNNFLARQNLKNHLRDANFLCALSVCLNANLVHNFALPIDFQLWRYHLDDKAPNIEQNSKVLHPVTLSFYDPQVKDEKKIQEVVDLTDYERSEELRKAKSRSKKNHSKFTLLRSRQPGNTVRAVGSVLGRD